MPLDPQAKAFLNAAIIAGLPPIQTIPLSEARARAVKNLTYTGTPETIHRVTDIVIPGPGAPLPARHYVPHSKFPLPTVLYLHGGGWVLNNLDTHDHVCRALANLSRCAVLSLDYRLAPEHKFPAAVEDAWAALKWLDTKHSILQADPSRLAIAGDSSGATLAAVTAIRARDKGFLKLASQVLIYPPTDYWTTGTVSYDENGKDYLLTKDVMAWFWENYLPHDIPLDDPEAFPLRETNLVGLPPALVVTAEYDPLRDEGEAYAQRLQAAGVPAVCTRYDGMLHGFIMHFHAIDKGRVCLKQMAEFLAKTLRTDSIC